jgi:hypothetical protein
MDYNPKEVGAGEGAHLAGDDATSAATANPAEDTGEVETAEHVDRSVR